MKAKNKTNYLKSLVFKNKSLICLVLLCALMLVAYKTYASGAKTGNLETGPTGFGKLNINACTFENSNNFNYSKRKFANDGQNDDFMGILPKTIKFESISVYYLHAGPVEHSKGDVLLLHGAAFSSEIWRQLGTMQILASAGFRVIAIDQPGFNRKTNGSYDSTTFLPKLCKILNLNFPAIISPSASGRFSVPFVAAGLAGAFVPIAPCCTNKYSLADWKRVSIPTMILHGESDKAPPSKFLLVTPNHVLRVMQSAGHSVYVDQPDLFHKLLINFLIYLSQQGKTAYQSTDSRKIC